MNLDDGVMINSAALWCLWNPSGTSPKPGGQNLQRQGQKDYDWAHLARYFPKRVDEKCQEDPSLAVATGSTTKPWLMSGSCAPR